MKILNRYLFRHYFVFLLIILPSIICLYLLIELFQKIDNIIEAHVSVSLVAAYFFLKIPQIVVLLWPLACLLAGLLTVIVLSRKNEILALRASGVTLKQFLSPLLISGFLVSLLLVIIQGFFVPKANLISRHIWVNKIIKEHPKGIMAGNFLFFHGLDSIWITRLVNHKATRLKDIKILQYNRKFKTKSFLVAKKAEYIDHKWFFSSVIWQRLVNNKWQTSFLKGLELSLPERPKDLASVTIPPNMMNALDLASYISSLRRTGEKAYPERVILWDGIFYPFLGVFVLYLGLSLILFFEMKSLTQGLALGLLSGIFSWVIWSFLTAFSSSGHIYPEIVPLIEFGTIFVIATFISRKICF